MTGFVFHNATAVDVSGAVDDAWLVSEGERILVRGQGRGWKEHIQGRTIIDADQGFLAPGFIDLHMHGGGGTSSEDGRNGILNALGAHHRHGTTRSVVSFVAGDIDSLRANLQLVAELVAENSFILGSHLEGPFLSMGRRGAHDAKYLRDPDRDAVSSLVQASRGTLRQVTVDPERSGSAEAIQEFVANGVRVAVGHTEAGYEAASEAFAQGASILTHSFNAMPGLGHRDPGPVMAAIDNPAVTLELILDLHHVHPRMCALLFDLAPERVALITDAMAGAAAPAGTYELGGLSVTVSDGVAVLEGTDTLAGSTLTLDLAIRKGVTAGIGLVHLVTAATFTPAKTLGLQHKLGRLEPGFMADIVQLDRDWNVVQTIAAGQLLS
jgi:N-acetylglucosamine-6-phosphate deacetylase